ncbi:orotidine-5'-phosphate decarboxylase [Athalassotoga sp.]|uniref:orotidine-5'-phosphate decarboxylase n=1 Tax=Athalassotoga sp. TaxID=2022597 RepID=UPI003D0802DD
MKFTEKIRSRMHKVGNVLVIGLDSDVEKLPKKFPQNAQGIYEFNKSIIEKTGDIVCAYKINSAFYEALGPEGMNALLKTRDLIGDLPVIYDVKRGDIESTARSYAKAVFDFFNFDAVTLSPYMGADAIDPFLNYKDKYAFVVCLSSNKSAIDFEYHGTPPLYAKVAKFVDDKNKKYGNCGLVVGATVSEKLLEISLMAKESIILIPGIGTQGGDVEATMNSVEHDRILVNVSRSIIFSEDPSKSAREYSKMLSI